MINNASDETLVQRAQDAMLKSYSPYSRFRVGAAILLESGEIITACNVENSSYGLSICAERVAASFAVSRGKTDFKKVAVVSDAAKPASPCGACRQFLSEFAPNVELLLKGQEDTVDKTSLMKIFPNQFSKKELENR